MCSIFGLSSSIIHRSDPLFVDCITVHILQRQTQPSTSHHTQSRVGQYDGNIIGFFVVTTARVFLVRTLAAVGYIDIDGLILSTGGVYGIPTAQCFVGTVAVVACQIEDGYYHVFLAHFGIVVVIIIAFISIEVLEERVFCCIRRRWCWCCRRVIFC